MGKPIEGWMQHPHNTFSLLSRDGAIQADIRCSPWHMSGGDAEAGQRSRRALALFLGAEDMARALLEIRDALAAGTLDPEGASEVCERALRKAGVIE